MNRLTCILWLKETVSLAPRKVIRLLEHFKTPEDIFRASAEEAAKVCDLSEAEMKAFSDKSMKQAEDIIKKCDSLHVAVLPITNSHYPRALLNIYDPPTALYVRGKLPDFNTLPSISVVGQRKATIHGTVQTEKIAQGLSEKGFIVVSGMAQGIDSASHRGALRGGTPTVAVFGTAIDRCYPKENVGLMRDIISFGCCISEYAPGATTGRASFPRRNRIISGLTLGTVVAEAGAESGSLITAGFALEQGRDVFAVPGPLGDANYAGTNDLIQNGAKLVQSADDIICEYAYKYDLSQNPPVKREAKITIPDIPAKKTQVPAPPKKKTVKVKKSVKHIAKTAEKPEKEDRLPVSDEAQALILRSFTGTVQQDDLAGLTGLSASQILTAITLLEIGGYVRKHPGGYIENLWRLQ